MSYKYKLESIKKLTDKEQGDIKDKQVHNTTSTAMLLDVNIAREMSEINPSFQNVFYGDNN